MDDRTVKHGSAAANDDVSRCGEATGQVCDELPRVSTPRSDRHWHRLDDDPRGFADEDDVDEDGDDDEEDLDDDDVEDEDPDLDDDRAAR